MLARVSEQLLVEVLSGRCMATRFRAKLLS